MCVCVCVHPMVAFVGSRHSNPRPSPAQEHSEAIEAMTWDPSGLQLVTCGALGHKILVHRAMPLGSNDWWMTAG